MRTSLVVLLAVLAIACAKDFSSLKYQGQTAQEKMDALWKEITADTTPYGWYSSLALLELFFENMKTTFDTYSDAMPSGRKKLIHSVGSVVQAEFIGDDGYNNPYTGIFRNASNVLLRLSLAQESNPKKDPSQNFIPGFGIKLLRDNVPSANLVAMYSLDGQDSWNFFKNDWSHHINSQPCSFALKLVAKKFATATPYIGRIGLKDWAQYDEKGNKVPDANLTVPFKLYFRPADDVKNMFPDHYVEDSNKQLAKVPVGSRVFDVYAVPKPHADAVKIGTIRTKSKFTTSRFGDKDLFFQHNYIEDDMGVHPEWKADYAVDPPIPSNITMDRRTNH